MDFRERYPDTVTSTAQACWNDDPSALRGLLDKGACVDAADNQGWFPVHVAAVRGSPACLRLVLDAMAEDDAIAIGVDTPSHDGTTPLIMAAEATGDEQLRPGALECIRLLVAAGADLTARRPDGWSALHAALAVHCEQAVTVLMEVAAEQLYNPLGPDQELVKLLEEGDDVMPLLSAALRYGCDLATLKMLLDHGASVSLMDARSRTPLMEAAYYLRPDALKLLCTARKTPPVWLEPYYHFGPLHMLVGNTGNGKRDAVLKMLVKWCCHIGVQWDKLFVDLISYVIYKDDETFFGSLARFATTEVCADIRGLFANPAYLSWLIEGSVRIMESFLEHIVPIIGRICFAAVIMIIAKQEVSRNQAVNILRLLENNMCRDCFRTRCSDCTRSLQAFRAEAYSQIERVPCKYGTQSQARRLWKVQCAVHELVPDDTWWDKFPLTPVFMVFQMVRVLRETRDWLTFGDLRLCPDPLLLIRLQTWLSPRRMSFIQAQQENLPTDLVCDPPSLLVIARSAIHDQLRHCARTSQPPVSVFSLARKLAAAVPTGLGRVITMEDEDTDRILQPLFQCRYKLYACLTVRWLRCEVQAPRMDHVDPWNDYLSEADVRRELWGERVVADAPDTWECVHRLEQKVRDWETEDPSDHLW